MALTRGNAPQLARSASGPAQDEELIDLSTTDYTPGCGTADGFVICTATGAVKIDTPNGTTITLPSGLAVGVRHDFAFTKMYKTGTTATGLFAYVR